MEKEVTVQLTVGTNNVPYTFWVIVNAPPAGNQPPYFSPLPTDQTVQEGIEVDYELFAVDPEGDSLTFSVNTALPGYDTVFSE